MATQYDIAFLRVLMNDGGTDKPTAMRCLQLVDQQAQRGRAVSAMEAAVRMGLIDEGRARDVDVRTRATLQGGAPQIPIGQSGVMRPSEVAAIQAALPPVPTMPPTPAPLPPTPGPPPAPPPAASPTAEGELAVERTMEFEAVIPQPPAPMPTVAAPPEASAEGWFDLAPHGTGLADFELGPKLGVNPTGIQYRGRRKSDQGEVTLQTLTPKFREHDALHQQILEDLQPWSTLTHERLACVRGIGESQGRTVVVYSAQAGDSVDQLLQAGPLDPGRALKIVYEVAQGLAAAHAAGVAHGDVRAATVVFDGEHAGLLFGGLARAGAIASGFGQFGMAFGHPAYVAPEVIRDKLSAPTPTADVYALGILAYELLCGRLPFPLEGEVLDVIKAHYEAPLPPPPAEVTFGAVVAALILRMVAKRPTERVPDASAVVGAIEALLAGKPLPFAPLPNEAAPEEAGESTGEISAASWNEQVRRSTGMVETFDPTEIEAVGPAEWSPDDSDGDGPGTDVNMSLMSAIKTKELDEAVAQAKKRREAAASKKGKGKKAKGGAGDGNKKQLIASAGGIVVVLAVMVGLFVANSDDKKPIAATPTSGASQLKLPAPPPKPKVEDQEVAAAISAYEDRGRELISSGKFKQAIALDGDLPTGVRSSPAGQIALKKLRLEAEEAASAKLDKLSKVVTRLIAQRDYTAARARVKRASSWAVNETSLQELKDRIKNAREQQLAPLKALKLEEKELAKLVKLRAVFHKRLKGRWNLLEEGGFSIGYPRSAGLKADLMTLSKARPTSFDDASAGSTPALRLAAGKTPVLIALEVPLTKFLDVVVELQLLKRPAKGARFALLAGVERKERKGPWRGSGLDWGLAPVSLRDSGRIGNVGAPPDLPTLNTNAPIRIEMKAFGRRPIRLRGNLQQRGSAEPTLGARGRTGNTRGYVALYLEQVEVYLTDVELRGLVDPSRVRGVK